MSRTGNQPHRVQLGEQVPQEHRQGRPRFRSRTGGSQSPFCSVRPSRATSGARTPIDPNAPRASVSTLQLQHLLENLESDQSDNYGVEELRDGFFDASFGKQKSDGCGETEPLLSPRTSEFEIHQLPSKRLFRSVYEDIRFFFRVTFTTVQGISLAKSFLAYFAGYVLCLLPGSRDWLGRYSYWITVACLFNHSGRTVGAQIDAAAACSVGGAFGLAVGSLALELAGSTGHAGQTYGGIIAVFWILFIGIASWVRCSLIKLYQMMISAGLAIIFVCLVGADAMATEGAWDRRVLWEFGIPWLVGLGICLLVNVVIWPDAGGKAVAYDNQFLFISVWRGVRVFCYVCPLPTAVIDSQQVGTAQGASFCRAGSRYASAIFTCDSPNHELAAR